MAKTPTIRIHQGNTSHAHCNRIYKAPHFCSLSEMQMCTMFEPKYKEHPCWAWHCYKNAVTTKEKYSKIKSDADFHAKICKKKNCGYLKYKVYFEKE